MRSAPLQWQPTSGLAIASFVLGLLGISVLGLVFGLVALSQIRRHRRQSGRGPALAGVWLSILWIFGTLVLLVRLSSGPA